MELEKLKEPFLEGEIKWRVGKTLNLQLKKELQKKYFDKGLSEKEVRYKMGGKLY